MHKFANFNEQHIDQTVTLSGFVKKVRNLGELIFIDLRDTTGIIQIVVDDTNSDLVLIAHKIRSEYFISVTGMIAGRKKVNPDLPSGSIELIANNIEIISIAKQTPLIIDDVTDALEDIRLEYRYLDLRRPLMQNKLKLRHQMMISIRNFYNNADFIEIETPILSKSTPEGARDFLVPSRVNQATFFALPQSPQVYKQLLMVSGFERYYQIAKCFRDEDLRSDRQPEFTQLDVEMSSVSDQEIMALTESMLKKVIYDLKDIKLNDNFQRMTYDDAMTNYGSDKPDTRFDLKLVDVTSIFAKTKFKVFSNVDCIKAINGKGGAQFYSRKVIDELEINAKQNGALGLA